MNYAVESSTYAADTPVNFLSRKVKNSQNTRYSIQRQRCSFKTTVCGIFVCASMIDSHYYMNLYFVGPHFAIRTQNVQIAGKQQTRNDSCV